MIPRTSDTPNCDTDNSDWGRDTQIIVDLALSPDRTFGNRTRLEKQARDGTGAAIILSAYPFLCLPN